MPSPNRSPQTVRLGKRSLSVLYCLFPHLISDFTLSKHKTVFLIYEGPIPKESYIINVLTFTIIPHENYEKAFRFVEREVPGLLPR